MDCKICTQLEEAVASAARPDDPEVLIGLTEAGLRNRSRQKEEVQARAVLALEKHKVACRRKQAEAAAG